MSYPSLDPKVPTVLAEAAIIIPNIPLQGPSYPMSLAVGVEKGQAVETLVVLWEAAQAQAEGSNALLCEELALLFSTCWQSLGKSHWLH